MDTWRLAIELVQRLRSECSGATANALELENTFSIKKDDFVTFMVRRLGPVPAVELLIESPDFAKSGISHEAYKAYVISHSFHHSH